MYAVDSMQIKMNAFGESAPAAPTLPNAGWKEAAKSGKNTPAGAAYAPPKNLTPIANAVYTIPIIPKREKGARDARFLSKHSGNKTVEVIPRSVLVLVNCSPAVAKIVWKVSASIIEYARVAATVMNVQLIEGMLPVSLLIDFSHASR